MSWPLPQPGEIAERYAQAYQADDAFPGCDPREPNSFMAVTGRTHGEVGFDLYLYQRSLADELMIDTAQDWLPRHANTYGVPRLQPQKAIGPVVFSGPALLALPDSIELVAGDGAQWITTASAVVGNNDTVTVQVISEAAGAIGNRAANTVLTIISPVLGLQLQTVTVGAGGLAGGLDIEAIDAWRQRVLTRKRKQGQAGNEADYKSWAADAGVAAAYTNVVRQWAGVTVHAIFIAMPNPVGGEPLAPTPAQVAAVQAAVDLVRPLTDDPLVIACAPLAVPLALALAKDTVANRALASVAFLAFLVTIPIGGLLDRSLLEDAIIQATGSGVEIVSPAANLASAPNQLLVAGPITWGVYA